MNWHGDGPKGTGLVDIPSNINGAFYNYVRNEIWFIKGKNIFKYSLVLIDGGNRYIGISELHKTIESWPDSIDDCFINEYDYYFDHASISSDTGFSTKCSGEPTCAGAIKLVLYLFKGDKFYRVLNWNSNQPIISNPYSLDEIDRFNDPNFIAECRSIYPNYDSCPYSFNPTQVHETLSDSAIIEHTIPETDFYRITVYGGSADSGGRGAKVVGTFKLVKDVKLQAITGKNGLIPTEDTTDLNTIHGSSGGDASVVSIYIDAKWRPLIVAGGGGGWCSKHFPIPPNTHSKKPPRMIGNNRISHGLGGIMGGKAIIVRYIIITNDFSNVKLVNLKIKNNNNNDFNLRDLLKHKSAKIVQGLLLNTENESVKPVSNLFKQEGIVCDADWNDDKCIGTPRVLSDNIGYKECAVACQRYFNFQSSEVKGCCQIDAYPIGKCSVIDSGEITVGTKDDNMLNTKCINQGDIKDVPQWKPISETESNYWMSVPPLYNNGQLSRPAFMQIDLGKNYLLKDLIFDFPNEPHKSNNNKLYLFTDENRLQWKSPLTDKFILLKYDNKFLKWSVENSQNSQNIILDTDRDSFNADDLLNDETMNLYNFIFIDPASSDGFMIKQPNLEVYLQTNLSWGLKTLAAHFILKDSDTIYKNPQDVRDLSNLKLMVLAPDTSGLMVEKNVTYENSKLRLDSTNSDTGKFNISPQLKVRKGITLENGQIVRTTVKFNIIPDSTADSNGNLETPTNHDDENYRGSKGNEAEEKIIVGGGGGHLKGTSVQAPYKTISKDNSTEN